MKSAIKSKKKQGIKTLLHTALILILVFIANQNNILAQESTNPESFFLLKDTVFKKELACFVLVNKNSDSLNRPLLLKKVGNFKAHHCGMQVQSHEVSVYIGVMKVDSTQKKSDNHQSQGFEKNGMNEKLEHLTLRYQYYHELVSDSAISDIYGLNLCRIAPKKKEKITNSDVYKSKLDGRVYVHLVLGSLENKYEVTFLFKSGLYVGRVIDEL